MSIEKDIHFIAESIEWQNRALAKLLEEKEIDYADETVEYRCFEKDVPVHITKKMIVKTNMDLIETEVDKLRGLLEEANSLIQELASTDLEVDLDI